MAVIVDARERPRALRGRVLFALLAVYIIWGSTYLALRFALESFPPFLMGGARYLLAGLLLFVYAERRGQRLPTLREWRSAALVGTLLFGLGNGLVGVAEQSIASSVAAIVVATTSLWAVLFATFWGARTTGRELLGIALGLLGVVLLQQGGAFAGSFTGLIAIVIAPIAWALGSMWSARLPLPRDGAMSAGAQMIAGGLVMLLVGAVFRERVGTIHPRAVIAFVYLMVFGSLIAFSAYQLLLRETRPAIATSYAYVNPVVALILGALLAAEPLGATQLLACGLTALAVLTVLRAKTNPP